MIKQIIVDLENKQARIPRKTNGSIPDSLLDVTLDDTRSNINARIEEIDYQAIQNKITEYAKEGHDMEALRLKIQWEARQLIENNSVKSTQINRIVHRDIRKEREWRDYIRINEKREPQTKIKPVKKPPIAAIIRI